MEGKGSDGFIIPGYLGSIRQWEGNDISELELGLRIIIQTDVSVQAV